MKNKTIWDYIPKVFLTEVRVGVNEAPVRTLLINDKAYVYIQDLGWDMKRRYQKLAKNFNLGFIPLRAPGVKWFCSVELARDLFRLGHLDPASKTTRVRLIIENLTENAKKEKDIRRLYYDGRYYYSIRQEFYKVTKQLTEERRKKKKVVKDIKELELWNMKPEIPEMIEELRANGYKVERL